MNHEHGNEESKRDEISVPDNNNGGIPFRPGTFGFAANPSLKGVMPKVAGRCGMRDAGELTYTVRLRPLADPYGRSPSDRLRLFLRTVEARFAFRADFVPEAAAVRDGGEGEL